MKTYRKSISTIYDLEVDAATEKQITKARELLPSYYDALATTGVNSTDDLTKYSQPFLPGANIFQTFVLPKPGVPSETLAAIVNELLFDSNFDVDLTSLTPLITDAWPSTTGDLRLCLHRKDKSVYTLLFTTEENLSSAKTTTDNK